MSSSSSTSTPDWRGGLYALAAVVAVLVAVLAVLAVCRHPAPVGPAPRPVASVSASPVPERPSATPTIAAAVTAPTPSAAVHEGTGKG